MKQSENISPQQWLSSTLPQREWWQVHFLHEPSISLDKDVDRTATCCIKRHYVHLCTESIFAPGDGPSRGGRPISYNLQTSWVMVPNGMEISSHGLLSVRARFLCHVHPHSGIISWCAGWQIKVPLYQPIDSGSVFVWTRCITFNRSLEVSLVLLFTKCAIWEHNSKDRGQLYLSLWCLFHYLNVAIKVLYML